MAPAVGEIRFADFRWRLKVARAGRVLARQADIHLRGGMPPLALIAFDHVGRSVELWGRYEREELDLLMACIGQRIDRNGLAIDVGANIGNHALFFADHFAEVLAVEPHPRTHAVLALNAALRRNVRTLECALSDREGRARLSTTPGNAGMASLAEPSAPGPHDGPQVRLQRLDEVEEIAGRRVALVKIDAEGHEAAVIRGAAAVLQRDRPVVVFEQRAEEIRDGTSPALEALRALGYERFWTVEDFPNSGIRVLDALRRRLSGAGLRMVEAWRLDDRFHSMVVALPPDR